MYVSQDVERTRASYEDLNGLPVVATWRDSNEWFGELRTYRHCSFELEDRSALVERTCDPPEALAADVVQARRDAARRMRAECLAGNHTSNNTYC